MLRSGAPTRASKVASPCHFIPSPDLSLGERDLQYHWVAGASPRFQDFASGVAAVVMLKSFRPLRYNSKAIDNLSSVVAPPYDVISDQERDALYDRSEWNSVRLILNRDTDRYAAAAELLAEW